MKVKEALDRLVSAIKKSHPQHNLSDTITGLSPEEVDQIEVSMPFASRELLELFHLYDFSCCNLFSPLYLSPPSEMKEAIDAQIDFYEEVDDLLEGIRGGWRSSSHEACKLDQSWRDKWIPIGDSNGNSVFIDMDPSENGALGQVVTIQESAKHLEVLGYSLSHWMERIATKLENLNSKNSRYSCFMSEKIEAPTERPSS
ncbi:MAG: SMI1/KNR4 family protein [Mariniblastus sp.]